MRSPIVRLALLAAAAVAQAPQQASSSAQADSAPPALSCTGGVVFAECSRFAGGFNATDGTAALQAALDYAPAHTIWVRNGSGRPWVVRPIFLRSNKTLRFAADTLVVAKRDEFHAKNASLFNVGYNYHYNCTSGPTTAHCGPVAITHKCCVSGAVSNVSLRGERGATLRMWRGDYADPAKYTKAEWRHGVTVLGGSSHIHIEGLRIELTGGDGISIGAGMAAVDVVVRNVTCDRNYRQGMSVINVRDLVVEDSVFSRTAGTDPQAGVDIEPSLDYFNESNITFTRCSFLYNTGSAFKISAGRLLNTSSFTLLVEDGTFIGGSMGSAGITMSFSGAKGSVVFRGGIVGPTVGPGLLLEDHTVGSAVAIFDRVQLIGTNTGPFVQDMVGWPINCTAPICIRCGHTLCLETTPADYDHISDRTPGGLIFAELEVDPACAGVGKGSHHCLPAHGSGVEPFAVVSTGMVASPAVTSVAAGSIIVHATAARACSVDRDTVGAFTDVAIDCRLPASI